MGGEPKNIVPVALIAPYAGMAELAGEIRGLAARLKESGDGITVTMKPEGGRSDFCNTIGIIGIAECSIFFCSIFFLTSGIIHVPSTHTKHMQRVVWLVPSGVDLFSQRKGERYGNN